MSFYFPKTAQGAEGFVRDGGSWEPDLHFTGSLGDNAEVEAVQGIINRHAEHLVAFYYGAGSGIRGSFSIELQFDSDKNAVACRTDYLSLFTPSGRLKKKHR